MWWRANQLTSLNVIYRKMIIIIIIIHSPLGVFVKPKQENCTRNIVQYLGHSRHNKYDYRERVWVLNLFILVFQCLTLSRHQKIFLNWYMWVDYIWNYFIHWTENDEYILHDMLCVIICGCSDKPVTISFNLVREIDIKQTHKMNCISTL